MSSLEHLTALKRSVEARRSSMAIQSKYTASGFDCSESMRLKMASLVRDKERRLALAKRLRWRSQTKSAATLLNAARKTETGSTAVWRYALLEAKTSMRGWSPMGGR